MSMKGPRTTSAVFFVIAIFCALNFSTTQASNPSNEKNSSSGWSYTKWGMTPAEVIEASEGKAYFLSKEESDSESTQIKDGLTGANLTTGKFNFKVVFLFDKGSPRLSGVRLYLNDTSLAMDLFYALMDKYGEPAHHSPDSYYEAKWLAGQLEIDYLSIYGKIVSVEYTEHKIAEAL